MSSTTLAVTLLTLASLTACASDFDNSHTSARATRAVESPSASNDASAEVRSGTADGVPLVTVGIPNHDGQTPQVRTAADNVHDTLNPPTGSSTPTTPPTTAPNTHIDPIHGIGE